MITAIQAITIKMIRNKPIEINIGDNTHHHDQSILPVNFKTTKIKVNIVPNPIPFEVVFVLLIIPFVLIIIV